MPILSSGGTALGALNVAVPAVRFNDVARELILKALNDALVRVNRRCQTELAHSGEDAFGSEHVRDGRLQ